uniref:Uncharacterized protein n=1 Tax=Caenorhabditis japonica TaxID=281687 RepID=A0A8R1IMP0_CAEJA
MRGGSINLNKSKSRSVPITDRPYPSMLNSTCISFLFQFQFYFLLWCRRVITLTIYVVAGAFYVIPTNSE